MRSLRRIGRWRASTAIGAAAVIAACDAGPIEWQGDRPVALPASAEAAPGGSADAHLVDGARLVLDEGGRVAYAPARPAAPLPDSAGLRACTETARFAEGRGGERYAVWWAVRPDSSALLLAAVSADSGRTWARVVPVDTLDRGIRACARPAPAVAADSVNGYLHVVYFLDAPEGKGLFYAHLMDPRARFEPPAVVVYGDGPAAASVASLGDVVAVAYEDPNRPRPSVELALSRTAGHLFEERHLDVSGDEAEARDPRVAVAAGGRIAVAWGEGGRRVVRVGRLR